MIDRTTLELRIAAHHGTTTTVNATAWRRQGRGAGHPLRAALAGALVALAARLDATALPARRADVALVTARRA
jgi:hypothetical protein